MRTTIPLLVFATACVPALDVEEWHVDRPRLLAVRSDPAEATPGATVRFEALVADPGGTPRTVDWSFCARAKPLAESAPVHRECLERLPAAITRFGAGLVVEGKLPDDGCRLFGPTPPVPKPGEPAARAVDPDATGGYQQPVLVDSPDATTPELSALARVRIRCGLVGATQAQSAEWTRRSTPNANPRIAGLTVDGVAVGETFTVPAGATVELTATWPSCSRTDDESASACEGAESYLVFDRVTRSLVRRREAVRVSWYVTAGRLVEPRTGVGEDAPDEAFTTNRWAAPASGESTLWAVIRDDRGGVSWASWGVAVRQ